MCVHACEDVSHFSLVWQLEAFYAGEPQEPGVFGGHLLYKNLGYFSLIGLLRLHTQLGDYYQALQCVSNVQLSKKVQLDPPADRAQLQMLSETRHFLYISSMV